MRRNRRQVMHAVVLEAIRGVRAHAPKHILSIISVAISLMALIISLSILTGARAEIESNLDRLGGNLLVAQNLPCTIGDIDPVGQHGDLPAVLGRYPSVDYCAYYLVGSLDMVMGVESVALYEIDANFARLRRLRLATGRHLSPADCDSNAAVCVVGAGLAKALMLRGSAIGRLIEIEGTPRRVVGVLAPEQRQVDRIQEDLVVSVDTSILLPLSRARSGNHRRSRRIGLIVKFDSLRAHERTMYNVAATLSARFGEGVEVIVPRNVLRQTMAVRRTYATIIAGCFVLLLLVGIIGTVNTMLTSVWQRRREIGIRRSIGASQTMVAIQFVLESCFIVCVGGLVGIATGMIACVIIESRTTWHVQISWPDISWSIVLIVGAGIATGLYPARVATKLTPADAMRT